MGLPAVPSSLSAAVRWLLAHRLAALLFLAAAVRLGAVLAFPGVFAFDQTGVIHGSEAYDTYARNLLATGVFGRTPGEPDAMIPPLYSYVLAAVYGVFGRGYIQVTVFHTLLDLISITALYAVGKRVLPHGEAAGWLAGLFYALYPYLVFQNLSLIDTPLFMALLYLFVLLMALLRARPALDRGAWGLAALGGLALGLATLVRPITPPLALLVGVWFLFRLNLRQTVARLLPVAALSVLALIPWVVRNDQVYGAFVPMTVTSGSNFWQGNSPYTVAYFRAGYDVQWTSPAPEEIEAEDLHSREADAERFALALKYLRENPDRIPELLWVKFLVHWSIDITPRYNPTTGEAPIADYAGVINAEIDEAGRLTLSGLPTDDPVNVYSQPLFDQVGRVVHRYYYGALFFLALAGVALTARRWREVSLLWFVQIAMTVVYLIFHPSTRYRAPTDPMLFLFSAYTVVALYIWLKARTRR